MNEHLIQNWNARVHKKDTVYVLGDFGLAPKEVLKHWLELLKGTKVLILGNHDVSKTAALEIGFSEVHELYVYKADGKRVILSHYPVESDYYDLCLHGHTHQKNYSNWETQFNVGVDLHNYCPLKWTDIRGRCFNE